MAEDADALTLRARLGFETGKAWNTSFLAEGDLLTALRLPLQQHRERQDRLPGRRRRGNRTR